MDNKTFKIFLSFVVAVLALIPTWAFTILYLLLGPADFWQSAVVVGFGLWAFGGAQFFMGMLGIALIVCLWAE